MYAPSFCHSNDLVITVRENDSVRLRRLKNDFESRRSNSRKCLALYIGEVVPQVRKRKEVGGLSLHLYGSVKTNYGV